VLSLLDVVQALGLLTGFALLGTRSKGAGPQWLAFQGILCGMIPIIMHGNVLTTVTLLALGNIGLKGIVFPLVLLRLRASASYYHEAVPFVGFLASMLLGIPTLALSVGLALRMTPALKHAPFGMLELSMFLIFVGLFLIVARRRALMQVIGYLVLENGIFVFSASAIGGTLLLVELGVLLDAFVAVFVMGIAILHIDHEFGSADVDQLSVLKG